MIIKRSKLILLAISIGSILFSCKKSTSQPDPVDPGGGGNTPPTSTDSVYAPVDPSTPATIGFFSNGWQQKSFTVPDAIAGAVSTAAPTDTLTIDVNNVLQKVVPYVYGNNSNLWSGQMVTEASLMQYIKDLSPNIIRAPAGSVSDIYFWNGADGSPAPTDAPATLVNADGSTSNLGPWYGGNAASWTFSLDNYYNLLAQTNSTGIISTLR